MVLRSPIVISAKSRPRTRYGAGIQGRGHILALGLPLPPFAPAPAVLAATVLAVVFLVLLPDTAQAHELGTPTNVKVTPLPGALKVSWNRVADGSRNNESPHYYVVRWRVKDPQSDWFGDRSARHPTSPYSVLHGLSGCTEDTDCSYTLNNSSIRADSYWRTYPDNLPTALLDPDKTYEVQVAAFGIYDRTTTERKHYHEWSDSAEGSPLATDVTLSGLKLWNATPGSDAPVGSVWSFGGRVYTAVMLQEVTSILVQPDAASFFEVNITVKLGESGTPQTVRHLKLSSAIDIPPNADPSVPHEIYVTLTAVNDNTNTATYTLKVYQYPPVSFGADVPDLTFTQGVKVERRLPSGSDDYDVTYTATGLPAGLSLSGIHRTIVGTPTTVTTAPATVTYTATGEIGSTASLTFDVSVAPPVTFDAAQLEPLRGRTIDYTIGQAARINETLPEAEGGAGDLTYHLTYGVKEESGWVDKTIDDDAPGLSFDSSTRVLTSDAGTGAPSAAAYYSVDYRAEDRNGSQAGARFTIVVNEAPSLPDAADRSFTVGETVSITLPEASDGAPWGNGYLRYELSPGVAGLSFHVWDRTITGTPLVPGSTQVTYTATDANDVSDSRTFTITVANGPNAPAAAPGSLEAMQETSHPAGLSASATWDAVSGATGYVVQVIADGGSYPDKPVDSAPDGVGLKTVTDGESHWAVISALSAGDYKVRVAARNDDGVGPWSAEASFTMKVGGV